MRPPFAAFFFPMAAHYPYDCPGATSGQHNHDDYLACIKYSDKLLGILLEDFGRLNMLQDTLFVIVGDHGESFGEHGRLVHNSSMYEEEVTVPLVFWSADARLAGQGIGVSRQIDIAPTIADFLNLMESSVPMQGISLLRRDGAPPPIFMSAFFDGVALALIEPPHKFIYEPPADTLVAFDLNIDPRELAPMVVSDPEKARITSRLKAFVSYQDNLFSP